MPTGTRVHRCVRHAKKSGNGVNPYAVCQSATGQSYATGKTMKYTSHMPKGAEQSPKGNIGAHRVMEGDAAIKGMKNKGSYDNAASYLPYREPKTAGGKNDGS